MHFENNERSRNFVMTHEKGKPHKPSEKFLAMRSRFTNSFKTLNKLDFDMDRHSIKSMDIMSLPRKPKDNFANLSSKSVSGNSFRASIKEYYFKKSLKNGNLSWSPCNFFVERRDSLPTEESPFLTKGKMFRVIACAPGFYKSIIDGQEHVYSVDNTHQVAEHDIKWEECNFVVRAVKSYIKQTEDELGVDSGSVILVKGTAKGWYKGFLKGNEGIFPADVVREIPKSSLKGQKAVALYNYSPKHPDEIMFKAGEVITVLETCLEDEGWWKGQIDSRIGLFPDNYVQVKDFSYDLEKLESESTVTDSDRCSTASYSSKVFNYLDNLQEDSRLSKDAKASSHSVSVLTRSELSNANKFKPNSGDCTFWMDSTENRISKLEKELDSAQISVKRLSEQFNKLYVQLIDELDEEKKARASLEVEITRLRKVLDMRSLLH